VVSSDPLAELVERVRAAEPRAGETRVVLVDGRSGSGKTALAARLAGELGAPIVELEHLYAGWDGLDDGIELLRTAVLEPLAAGDAVFVPHYDWLAERWAEPRPLAPTEVLVVEGVGAGARAAARYASLLIWVELAADERMKRALARDGDLYRPHWERWAAQEDALLARENTPARADVVL
jgi:uridine kinase